MNWICPKSEEGWAELLSAYVDGELSAHEAEALRAYFDQHPERAGQVADLQAASRALEAWTVPEAALPAGFLIELDRAAATKKRGGIRTLITSYGRIAAIFLVGVFSGVGATLVALDRKEPETEPPAVGLPAEAVTDEGIEVAGSPYDLSPRQAAALRREVEAEGVVKELEDQIRRRRWEEARGTYAQLIKEFADTVVVTLLREDRGIRRLEASLQSKGRIGQ